MFLLIVTLVLILMIGPLRRLYFRHARFTLPATVAAVVAYGFGSYVMVLANTPMPYSFLIPLTMACGAALGAGESCKAWLDGTFGPRKQEHDRPRT